MIIQHVNTIPYLNVMLRKLPTVVLTLSFSAIPVLCSVFIPPDEYFIAGFFTLGIPVAIIFLITSFFFFADRRSRWVLLPFSILLLSIPLLSSSFSFVRKKGNIRQPAVHVLTHNMNALQYYKKPANFTSNKKAFQRWIGTNDFDIICLQEMVEVHRDSFLIPGYKRLSSVKNTLSGDNLGLFIFTRYPVVREGKIEFAFNSYNRLMWADVIIGHDTIRVINVHLMSYDLEKGAPLTNLGKIRNALRARSWHAKLISQFLSECRNPVILCGDFNETPISYPYRKIKGSLEDTFAGSGLMFQYSFRFAGLPVRIDHILISPSLRADNYNVSDAASWSDHRPVSVNIGWPVKD